jgi:hypothetical protein
MNNKQVNPWLDPLNENWILKEIDIVKDRKNLGFLSTEKAIEWMCINNQENRLFQSLTSLAPIYPLIAFHGDPSLWLAPPLSGSGNDIVVVMGRDQGQLRMVGCNFCAVNLQVSNTKSISNFWGDYDGCKSDLQKYRLISTFVSENLDHQSLKHAIYVDDQCFDYRTMPLYIVCIDSKSVHVWSTPCLIWPTCPSDMSLELVREF